MIFIFFLGPPSPGGSRGRVRSGIFPKEIVGFGPIPARIRRLLILIVALSTARINCGGPYLCYSSTKPYEFIGFGGIHGPKPYESIGFGGYCASGGPYVRAAEGCLGALALTPSIPSAKAFHRRRPRALGFTAALC